MGRIFLVAEDGRWLSEARRGRRGLLRPGPRHLATSVTGWMWDWKRQGDEHHERGKYRRVCGGEALTVGVLAVRSWETHTIVLSHPSFYR